MFGTIKFIDQNKTRVLSTTTVQVGYSVSES